MRAAVYERIVVRKRYGYALLLERRPEPEGIIVCFQRNLVSNLMKLITYRSHLKIVFNLVYKFEFFFYFLEANYLYHTLYLTEKVHEIQKQLPN